MKFYSCNYLFEDCIGASLNGCQIHTPLLCPKQQLRWRRSSLLLNFQDDPVDFYTANQGGGSPGGSLEDLVQEIPFKETPKDAGKEEEAGIAWIMVGSELQSCQTTILQTPTTANYSKQSSDASEMFQMWTYPCRLAMVTFWRLKLDDSIVWWSSAKPWPTVWDWTSLQATKLEKLKNTKFAAINTDPGNDVQTYDQMEQDLIDLSQETLIYKRGVVRPNLVAFTSATTTGWRVHALSCEFQLMPRHFVAVTTHSHQINGGDRSEDQNTAGNSKTGTQALTSMCLLHTENNN